MAKVREPVVPSSLYRYRSLTRNKKTIDHEIAAITENYLFCSNFLPMNDPMEGYYQPNFPRSKSDSYSALIEGIRIRKFKVGIACFSERMESVLMWAHYAGNYSGMCLAYSSEDLLRCLPLAADLVRLVYMDEPPAVEPVDMLEPISAARRILSQKKSDWAYECEWRVLASVGKVTLEETSPVRAIYFGSRIDPDHKKKVLSVIENLPIKAYAMEINGYSHYFIGANSAAGAEIIGPSGNLNLL